MLTTSGTNTWTKETYKPSWKYSLDPWQVRKRSCGRPVNLYRELGPVPVKVKNPFCFGYFDHFRDRYENVVLGVLWTRSGKFYQISGRYKNFELEDIRQLENRMHFGTLEYFWGRYENVASGLSSEILDQFRGRCNVDRVHYFFFFNFENFPSGGSKIWIRSPMKWNIYLLTTVSNRIFRVRLKTLQWVFYRRPLTCHTYKTERMLNSVTEAIKMSSVE